MEQNAICNIPVAAAFPGGVDSLPQVKANILAQFGDEIGMYDMPMVLSVFMLGAKQFSAQFNDETEIDALPVASNKFALEYNGPISEIEFHENTVLSAFQVEWGAVSGSTTARNGSGGSGGTTVENAVLVIPQNLTDEQKKTARDNIGAVDAEYVENKLGVGTFVFNQAIASKVWNISHNLNKYPSVTVVDSAGTSVIGEVSYPDKNNVVITFTAEFSGSAYLN